MAPIVDLGSAEERPPITPGIYRARILSCEQKLAKSSGNKYLSWKFETSSLDPNLNHRWVYLNTTLSGRGAQMMKRLVQAVFHDYESGPINTDLMIGQFVNLTLENAYDEHGNLSAFPRVMDVERADETIEEDDFSSFVSSTGEPRF